MILASRTLIALRLLPLLVYPASYQFHSAFYIFLCLSVKFVVPIIQWKVTCYARAIITFSLRIKYVCAYDSYILYNIFKLIKLYFSKKIYIYIYCNMSGKLDKTQRKCQIFFSRLYKTEKLSLRQLMKKGSFLVFLIKSDFGLAPFIVSIKLELSGTYHAPCTPRNELRSFKASGILAFCIRVAESSVPIARSVISRSRFNRVIFVRPEREISNPGWRKIARRKNPTMA